MLYRKYSISILLLIFISNWSLLIAQNTNDSDSSCPLEYVWQTVGPPCLQADYELVFYDEFEGTELNETLWITTIDTADADPPGDRIVGDYNGGTVFNPENVSQNNGILTLTAKAEGTIYHNLPFLYNGGRIICDQNRQLNHDMIWEVRMKIPHVVTDNNWKPAIWAWASEKSEIHLFELDGNNNMETNIWDWTPEDVSDCRNKYEWNSWPNDEAFHTYKIEITRNFIEVTLDGALKTFIPKYQNVAGQPILPECDEILGLSLKNKQFPQNDGWYGPQISLGGNILETNLSSPVATMEVDYVKMLIRKPCNGPTTDPILITGNQTITGDKDYSMDITVDADATLTINDATLSFPINKGILLKDGATLNVQNSSIQLLERCGGRWTGIKDVSKTQGVTINLEDAIIDGALIGMDLNPLENSSNSTLNIATTSTISNCQIGIRAHNDCNNIAVENMEFLDNQTAISLYQAKDMVIRSVDFDGNETGIDITDSYVVVDGGNLFQNGSNGIVLYENFPMGSGLVCGNIDEDPNEFLNLSKYGIKCFGGTHPMGLQILNNKFTEVGVADNGEAISIFGPANANITYNAFSNNKTAIWSYSTGNFTNDYQSRITCSTFEDISNGDVWFSLDNDNSVFLGNDHSLGEHVANYVFLQEVEISSEIGTAGNPAGNCFYIEDGQYTRAFGFIENYQQPLYDYHFENAIDGACFEPNENQNYTKRFSTAESDHCGGHIGPFGLIGGGTSGWQFPPGGGFCATCIKDAISIAVDEYVSQGGDDPRTWINETTSLDNSEAKMVMNTWINYGLHIALETRDYAFGESILNPLTIYHWQKKQYAWQVLQKNWEAADQLLQNLPQPNSEAIEFVQLQELYLDIFGKQGMVVAENFNWNLLEEEAILHSTLTGQKASLRRILLGEETHFVLPDLPSNPEARLIKWEKQINGLHLTPNPATDKFTLSWLETKESSQKATLSLWTMTGIRQLSISNYQSGQMVPTNQLPIGVYLLTLRMKSGKSFTERLIIAR